MLLHSTLRADRSLRICLEAEQVSACHNAAVVRCAQVLYTENRQWSTNNDKYTFKVSLHCVFYVQWPFSLVTIQHFHERKQLVKSTKTNSTFRPQLLYISAQTLPTSYFYGDSCWSIKVVLYNYLSDGFFLLHKWAKDFEIHIIIISFPRSSLTEELVGL